MDNPSFSCPDNPVVGSINLCSGKLEIQTGYAYVGPHKPTAIAFVVLFSLSLVAHVIQAGLSRRWFLFPTIIACVLGELIGWAARLISAVTLEWMPSNGGYYDSSYNAFMAQIAVLIISPAFLAAFFYITLGRLIRLLGPQYCRFSPRTYTIVFVGGDIVSLVVQAVGGASAAGADTLDAANQGANVMVAGVIIQMVIMILYSAIFAEWLIRYHTKRPAKPFRFRATQPVVPIQPGSIPPRVEKKANTMIGALIASTVYVFIRSVFRTIELLEGWEGPIQQKEGLFTYLDGLQILLAVVVINIFHPLWYLPREQDIAEKNGVLLGDVQQQKQERQNSA